MRSSLALIAVAAPCSFDLYLGADESGDGPWSPHLHLSRPTGTAKPGLFMKEGLSQWSELGTLGRKLERCRGRQVQRQACSRSLVRVGRHARRRRRPAHPQGLGFGVRVRADEEERRRRAHGPDVARGHRVTSTRWSSRRKDVCAFGAHYEVEGGEQWFVHSQRSRHRSWRRPAW